MDTKIKKKENTMKKITIFVLCLMMLAGCTSGSSESTYSATATGYGGDVTVTITVSDGKITKAEISGDGETENVGQAAFETLANSIVENNTYDIDVVSEATVTSTAVKKATEDAMTQAGLLGEQTAGVEGACTVDNMSLEDINTFLNESADMGEGTVANAVAVIPINHVDGPRNETNFYAFVNFKYKARSYIKYQITYLSCTCRQADVNFWQTAYVELTLPDSKDIKDAEVRTLSFDKDSTDHYLAGFWGDSNPTPAGATYEQFKEEYIPFFIGKNYEYISTLSFQEDIDPALYTEGEGRENLTLDTFTGSSVSTNNIIRMLNALFEYHATDEYFQS